MNTYQTLIATLQPYRATLVAVSKTHPPDAILTLYEQGQRVFGENKAQELMAKQAVLPPDIEWHWIGHLQTNKVKYMAGFVSLIHTVDSLRLLQEIDRQANKHGRVIACLLQFKVAAEVTKYGLSEEEGVALLEACAVQPLPNVQLVGVMGMGTFTDDLVQVRQEFRALRGIFDRLRARFFANAPHFKEISMGMSGDFQIALEEGSTMVRVGSLLFGERNY